MVPASILTDYARESMSSLLRNLVHAIYRDFCSLKKCKISAENVIFIFAQNIDCGYMGPRRF